MKKQMIPFVNMPSADEMNDFLHDSMESNGKILNALLNACAREEGIPDGERLSPDSFGAERLFLEYFVNDEMSHDFPLIARDFLLHEYNNIKDHEDIEYVNVARGSDWPDRVFNRFVLNLMMNAVKSGSKYAQDLFRSLYKTYYKKEYNTLKKFSIISSEEILTLAKPDRSNPSYYANLARILCISNISEIQINRDCNYIYAYLNEVSRKMDELWNHSYEEVAGDAYKECLQEIDEKYDVNRLYSLDAKASQFLGKSLRWMGYCPEYVEICDDNEMELVERLALTLSILRKTFPKKELSEEDIVLYGTIFHTVSALTRNADWLVDQLGIMAYGEKYTDFYDLNPSLFKPAEVDKSSIVPESTEKEPPKPQVIEKSHYNEDTPLAELDILRRKLHKYENDNNSLRKELAESKKQAEEKKAIVERLDTANRELAALRSHVYNLTEEESESKISLDEMRNKLSEFRIVIIGGHPNWVNKLKKEFPDWVFISPKASGTSNVDIVDRADYVYFFTEMMGHPVYFQFMNVVRERKVAFGYIHDVNIEKNVKQIYRELVTELN